MEYLTKEVHVAITAHNTYKPEPCYNENWNKEHKTGTMRARNLVMAALSYKHGICSGSMRTRKASKQTVIDYLVYHTDATVKEWAELEEVK